MNIEKFKHKTPVLAALCVMMLSGLFSTKLYAYDFGVNGIYYNKTSESEVEVTGNSESEYRGNIVIPSSVNYDGVNYSVTSIGNSAFESCSSLTSIEIPNSVTSIGNYAFFDCTSLTSIEIPNSVTFIEFYAFAGCTSLTSIEIPNSVISIWPSAFINCRSLTSIEIPNSVLNVGDSAFYGCSSLTSIEIPNSVFLIGSEAFAYCTSLTSIEIPNSVTSIGNRAFESCTSLTSIEIPNSVPSIGNYTFCGCTSLTSIEIPNSVTSIGNGAFDECSSLTSVTSLPLNPPTLGTNVFYNTPSTKTLYIHKFSLEAYRSSSWADEFTNIQHSLSQGLIIETEGNGKVYIGGEEVVSGTKYETGSLNLFILADDGYEIASATIEGADVEELIINHILTIDDCEDVGTLKVVFAPENEASLTVKGHESHSLTHYYKEGTQAKIDLSASEGWELYSLTFNGEDVKGDVVGNTYTTPALTGANDLEIVMKSNIATDAEMIEMPQRKITFRKYGNTVEILNLEDGEPISIYNTEGVCEYQGDRHTITLNANNVYILRTQSEVLKFTL